MASKTRKNHRKKIDIQKNSQINFVKTATMYRVNKFELGALSFLVALLLYSTPVSTFSTSAMEVFGAFNPPQSLTGLTSISGCILLAGILTLFAIKICMLLTPEIGLLLCSSILLLGNLSVFLPWNGVTIIKCVFISAGYIGLVISMIMLIKREYKNLDLTIGIMHIIGFICAGVFSFIDTVKFASEILDFSFLFALGCSGLLFLFILVSLIVTNGFFFAKQHHLEVAKSKKLQLAKILKSPKNYLIIVPCAIIIIGFFTIVNYTMKILMSTAHSEFISNEVATVGFFGACAIGALIYTIFSKLGLPKIIFGVCSAIFGMCLPVGYLFVPFWIAIFLWLSALGFGIGLPYAFSAFIQTKDDETLPYNYAISFFGISLSLSFIFEGLFVVTCHLANVVRNHFHIIMIVIASLFILQIALLVLEPIRKLFSNKITT